MKNRFQLALARQNPGRPPVWLMRQAGRYHQHYQALKARHSFVELCKDPALACETTMGPIRDFDFDAAILFSDLLFPLESMGMGLTYDPGPKLSGRLQTAQQAKALKGTAQSLEFQAEALRLIRAELDPQKGLLGFVGGPFTLFCYAVEGSHQGELTDAKRGLSDGRWQAFLERACQFMVDNMVLQAQAGPDAVAVLDTCAGELSPEVFHEFVAPSLRWIFTQFRERCPDTALLYYSKGTQAAHWNTVVDSLGAQGGIGVDWRVSLADTLSVYGSQVAVQGNIDPQWLFLPSDELERRLRQVWGEVLTLSPELRRGWICGLGHGVLPQTPESNVRLFVQLQRELFGEDLK